MARTVACIVAVALAGLTGALGGFAVKPPESRGSPAWTETAWPFPIDQWGTGKVFECKAADCGADVSVYLRAKIGFCNCTRGVADDEELDRVGDLALLSSAYSAVGSGRPVTAARMQGRSRSYLIPGPLFSSRSALAIALNERCDVVVATAVANGRLPPRAEAAVIAFLDGEAILQWAEVTLGL